MSIYIAKVSGKPGDGGTCELCNATVYALGYAVVRKDDGHTSIYERNCVTFVVRHGVFGDTCRVVVNDHGKRVASGVARVKKGTRPHTAFVAACRDAGIEFFMKNGDPLYSDIVDGAMKERLLRDLITSLGANYAKEGELTAFRKYEV